MKMMLMKLLFLLLAIPVIGGSLKMWKPNGFSVGKRVTKKILESCYVNDPSSSLIVTFGDFIDFIDDSVVVRMDNFLKVDERHEWFQVWKVETTKFIVMEDSLRKLQSDLSLLRETRWWNHKVPFFIVGKNHGECKNFKDILNTTSTMDVINSIYICSESENITALYTSNPITNYAPSPWEKIEDVADFNVYRQVFDPNTSCNNLTYDKTKLFNGYPIKAIMGATKTEFISAKDYMESSPGRPTYKLFHSIMKVLNVSLAPDWVQDENRAVLELDDRTFDITYSPYSWDAYNTTAFLFPHVQGQLVAIMKLKPEVSTLQKILHLWSPPVLMAASVTLVIFFIILVMKNHKWILAVLDMIRFLVYASIQTNTRHSFRIYFTTMLIFIIISNGVFQGKIAAFLTTRERIEPAKTVNELIDSGYEFYSYAFGYNYMSSTYEKIILKQVSYRECIEYLLNGTHNVCVLPLSTYESELINKPLDYVKKPVKSFLCNFKCRHDWPLYDRVNTIVVRVLEAGLHDFWVHQITYGPRQKRKADDADLLSPEYRPVKLVKLHFAFKLLAVGLSIAAVVFMVEFRDFKI